MTTTIDLKQEVQPIVKLPDGRLFCVIRTSSGSPFWSVSADTGETWIQPRRLLRRDGGAPLLHPLSPCPLSQCGTARRYFGIQTGNSFCSVGESHARFKPL